MSDAPLPDLKHYLTEWFPEFAYRPGDDSFFRALAAEFPDLDLLGQLKAFHAWSLDRFDGKRQNYRLSFRRWLVYASKPTPF